MRLQEHQNLTGWQFQALENSALDISGPRVSFPVRSNSTLECAVGSRGLPTWGRHQWSVRVESTASGGSSGVLLGVYFMSSFYLLMEERHAFVLLNCSSGRVLSRGSWGNGVHSSFAGTIIHILVQA